LGLFRHEKKVEIEEETTTEEDIATQNEIKSKEDRLESILKKLSSVKDEYDTAVSNLMSVKKEWMQKSNELASMRKEYGGLFSDIESARSKLESTQNQYEGKKSESDKLGDAESDIKKFKKEYEISSAQVKESELEFSQIKKRQQEAEVLLVKTHIQMNQTKQELEKLKLEKQSIKNKTGPGKKGKTGEIDFSSLSKAQGSNQIVRAASEVVSKINSKLHIAESEIETLTKLLEVERKNHNEAKMKLESERKSKKSKQ